MNCDGIEIEDTYVYFTCMCGQVYALDCADSIKLDWEKEKIDPWATLGAYDEAHGTHWWGFAQELYPARDGEWMGKHVIRLTDPSVIEDPWDLEFYRAMEPDREVE